MVNLSSFPVVRTDKVDCEIMTLHDLRASRIADFNRKRVNSVGLDNREVDYCRSRYL